MTVSAVSKLIPRPPARVDSRNAKSGEPGALKCSMLFFRTSDGTVPTAASGFLPVDQWRLLTVQSLIDKAPPAHVIPNDIEQSDHLTEDEHPVSICLESSKQLVQQNHLSRVHDQAAQDIRGGSGGWLCAVEKVWVVAKLNQFSALDIVRVLTMPSSAPWPRSSVTLAECLLCSERQSSSSRCLHFISRSPYEEQV